MMRKIIFIIQVSSLFHSTNEKNLIGENNMVTKQKNPTGSKNTIKRPIRKKNENKIVVIIGTIMIILLVVLCFKNNDNEINKEKGENQKRTQKEQEQLDFNFLKTVSFEGKAVFTQENFKKEKKIRKILKNYQQEEDSSGLYVFYKQDHEDFIVAKFVNAHRVCITDKINLNNRQDVNFEFLILIMVLDLQKFEKKYRNKVVTTKMIEEYVDSPENQRN